MRPFNSGCVALVVASLAACGGSSDPDRGSLAADPTTITTITTMSAAQIDAATVGGLQTLSGPARCDVKFVGLNYNTRGPAGELTNASAVMLVPTGACTAAAPLLAYARGTEVSQVRTLANPSDRETFLLAAMYAAQGYAVVATTTSVTPSRISATTPTCTPTPKRVR